MTLLLIALAAIGLLVGIGYAAHRDGFGGGTLYLVVVVLVLLATLYQLGLSLLGLFRFLLA